MGILDSILGGSESTTAPSTVFGPQADFLTQFFPQLQQLLRIFDPSQLTPGFTQTELEGQQKALQAAGGFGQGFINPAQQAISQLFGAADPNDPTTQAAITGATRPIFENFQNVIAPSIRRASIGNQPGGGSRGALQVAQAGQEALRTAGDVASGISLGARGQGLQAIQGGLGAVPSIAGLSFLPSQVQREIGAEQRGLQGQQAAAPLTFLDMLRQLAGPTAVLGGGGSSSQQRGITQGFGDIFGG